MSMKPYIAAFGLLVLASHAQVPFLDPITNRTEALRVWNSTNSPIEFRFRAARGLLKENMLLSETMNLLGQPSNCGRNRSFPVSEDCEPTNEVKEVLVHLTNDMILIETNMEMVTPIDTWKTPQWFTVYNFPDGTISLLFKRIDANFKAQPFLMVNFSRNESIVGKKSGN